MATDIQDEREAFNRYLDEHCGGSMNGHTLEESLADFREYQRQLADCRAKVQAAIDSADSEGTEPLTEERLDEMIGEWNAELRKEGVID